MTDFDKYDAKYYEVFGKPYPIMITSQMTEEQHIARIKNAIETNKPVELEELDKDKVY